MLDRPGNNGKMTSHKNFKLKFSKSYFVLVRDFYFEFDLI